MTRPVNDVCVTIVQLRSKEQKNLVAGRENESNGRCEVGTATNVPVIPEEIVYAVV